MFNNVGEKIKGVAEFITWIGIIVSVIAGLAMMFALRGRGFVLGIIVAGIGSLVSWLSSITLYAFGQLVESTEANVEMNRQILRKLNEHMKSEKKETVEPPKQTVAASDRNNSHKQVQYPSSAAIFSCPECGKPNKHENSICWNCGVTFTE